MSRSPEEQTQPTVNSVAQPKAAITEFDSFWALLNISGHGRIVIALFFLGLAASLYLSPRLLQPTKPSHLPALEKTDS